jgi:uncharacterized protein YciI
VEYFVYCRGRRGTGALLEELAEAHWSFMDGYAEAMIAGGPTLTPDRTTWTGSMHMVDLPDAQAARVFAFQEALLPSWRVRAPEAAQRRWFGEPGHRDGFILGGPLLSDDGAGWVGSALLVQLGDRAAVEAMLAGAPYVQAGLYASVGLHDWQFGGRHQG